jgi:hypothetical protein
MKGTYMKLLLTTIESDEARTDLALKYLYCVLADSPMEVRLRSFGRNGFRGLGLTAGCQRTKCHNSSK